MQGRFQRGNGHKPLGFVPLNLGHGLTQNLVGAWIFNNLGGGGTSFSVGNLINVNDGFAINDTSVVWTPYGPGSAAVTDQGITGLNPSGSGGVGVNLASPSTLLQPAKALSIFWKGVRTTNPSGSNHPAYVAMYVTNGSGSLQSPFVSYGMNDKSDNHGVVFYFDALGGGNNTLNAGSITNNVPFDCAQTLNGATGDVFAYFNGRQVATANRGANTTISYTNPVLRACYNFANENSHGVCDVIYIWNRVLSAAEMIQLHDDPYSLISPIYRRPFAVLGSATPSVFIPKMDYQSPAIMAQ